MNWAKLTRPNPESLLVKPKDMKKKIKS